jgi:hypothetical protein
MVHFDPAATADHAILQGRLLPWLAIIAILLAFSVADDLARERVRRAFLVIALGLMGATAVAAAISPGAVPGSHLLVAAGPLTFLLGQQLLRFGMRAWTGCEPVLMSVGVHGRGGGANQAANYLYSFVVGVLMLLAVSPALGQLLGFW